MPRRNRTPRRRQASRYRQPQTELTDVSELDGRDYDRMARRLVEQGKVSSAVMEGVYGTPRGRLDAAGTPGGPSKVEQRPETLTRAHVNSSLSIENGGFSGGGGR